MCNRAVEHNVLNVNVTPAVMVLAERSPSGH